jgi:hypothetical protein
LLPELASTIKIKSCQKVVKICSKFRHTWKKPNKNNGAKVEKVYDGAIVKK